jgi:capsular exopolysaccharide synthesis family protein
MNRMEEAFQRARRDRLLPDTFAAPDATALEQFPSAVPLPSTPAGAGKASGRAAPAAATATDGPVVSAQLSTARSNRWIDKRLGPTAEKLVTSPAMSPVTVEQYRRLAATLHHAQSSDGIKLVMIASALAGEGKTLTAVNLALTLSESYERRVLLIDADLRRPMLHQIFDLPNGSGLHEGLKAVDQCKLAVFEISSRLALLPAGKPDPDPMSALTSDRMRGVIEDAAEKFDWVIIDTPPVGLLPDAGLLAAMVNAVVLVIHAGRTPLPVIRAATETVGRHRVIGVVLNLVDERAVTPAGKYDRYYRDAPSEPLSPLARDAITIQSDAMR